MTLDILEILKVKGIVHQGKGIYASCVWGSQAEYVYTGLFYPVYTLPPAHVEFMSKVETIWV